jgi:hypothetical protein
VQADYEAAMEQVMERLSLENVLFEEAGAS